MQTDTPGLWPKINVTTISFHVLKTTEVFHPVELSDEEVGSLFWKLMQIFGSVEQPFPRHDEDIRELDKRPFRVVIGPDEDDRPCAVVFGTDIHNVEYAMLVLRVFPEGMWFRIIQHTFFFKEPVPAQCSEALYHMLRDRGLKHLGLKH